MERITQKNLEYLVKRINEITGSPAESWTRKSNGDYSANVGNYHLDYAYGGVSLERMTRTTGSVNMISGIGHVPKRELYNWMRAFLAGIELRKS
jgi:hypothetical protein